MPSQPALPNAREILRKVRQVEIRSRRLVTESLAGAYHSVFKGQGINFEEVREYVPGDDVRRIDWNVTAKLDRPFVKVYREERELTILLVVDLSPSIHFGTVHRSMGEQAAELACVLALSAVRNNDKVGLCLFDDKLEKYIRPGKGTRHVLRLISEILFPRLPAGPQPQGRTDLAAALRSLNHLFRRRAVVFLLSDFLRHDRAADAPAEPFTEEVRRLLAVTRRRHDLVCVDLSDPRLNVMPNTGILVLEDAETGELIEIDTTPSFCRSYAKAMSERRQALTQSLRQLGVDQFSIGTDQPYDAALRNFLRTREKRR